MESFDVVVVGGRCAGAALANYLARAGMHVCLVDKATFPSETPSTHVIQPRGVEILDELGVLGPVLAQGAAQLDRFTLVNDDVRIEGVVASARPGLNVRRTILDHALQREAIRAGVDVRNGCPVRGVRKSGGRVTGVETADGPIDCDLVVGADGCRSVVAEAVGAREYLVQPPGRVPVWGYFDAGPQEPRLRIARKGNLGFLASPTDSGLYLAGVAVDHAHARAFNRAREANFRAALRAWPELYGIVRGADRAGSLRVMANWHSYFRESAGPGWVLVGDAGHFKDFTPAQGIADALCQARSLSAAIRTASPERDRALYRWWQHRDHSSYDMHWLAVQMGRPGTSPPLITELLRCVADDPDGATTLLRVLDRELPSTKLFTPSRLLAATSRTLRKYPDQRWSTFADIGRAVTAEVDKRRARLRLRQPSATGRT